ncbi:MAG: hypothetical protein PGN16_04155 [Sphingomonas phyllosphaerae]|uniref:hypothetical protein n=1 Tax=Sphingomonas phyllosphaerae TaxID=257003 RepID=UPI002FF83054
MRRSFCIRIDCDPPARFWSGVGDLLVPADMIEAAPAVYLGGGELLDGFTDVQQFINGTAGRTEISVSGVAAATQKLAIEEADDVKGASVDVGVIVFDDEWQVQSVTWAARYRADKLSVTRQDTSRTITLSMGSDDTGRSSAPQAYWTHADQQRRSPGDMIFDHVSGINSGTSRPFGTNG